MVFNEEERGVNVTLAELPSLAWSPSLSQHCQVDVTARAYSLVELV